MEIKWILIIITCAFILSDLVTGFSQAIKNHELDSTKMKQGLWHKCGFLMAIMFGLLCDVSMFYFDLGFILPIMEAICLFIIGTETVSVLENLAKISPELASSKFMEIFKTKE